MKRSHKGFAPLETVLVLVIVGILAFTAWYIFHSKSNTDTSYSTTASTQNQILKKPQTKQSTSTTPAASKIVQTKTDATLGQYLADASGNALYTYGSDSSGVSNCTGACLTDWPIYKATSSTNLPTNLTVITRSDGGTQYAYKGMPLYTFTADSSGKVTGDGVSGFSVAKP